VDSGALVPGLLRLGLRNSCRQGCTMAAGRDARWLPPCCMRLHTGVWPGDGTLALRLCRLNRCSLPCFSSSPAHRSFGPKGVFDVFHRWGLLHGTIIKRFSRFPRDTAISSPSLICFASQKPPGSLPPRYDVRSGYLRMLCPNCRGDGKRGHTGVT
jgi:hypothetical protein